MNRKLVFSVMTILIMLITSRFFVRIIDATVQIDDDIGILIVLLILLNTAIGAAGFRLYRRAEQKMKS
ncbi:MAG: hypothetical protein IJ130_00940 [Solobacterium sp.]|nr:hypothetical protein [Solobacterium sp.]